MTNSKITALSELASADIADSDVTVVVDVSDTSMASTGTNKKFSWTSIKAKLKTYFDTLYPSGSGSSTGTNTGDQTPTSLGLVIGTNVQAYDADLTTWAGVTPGTGVTTALAVAVGSSGALVANGGALGTPSSGTATNLTGLPASGVTGTALVASAIGTTVQAYDAQLADVAGLTATDNGVIIGNGTNFVVESGATLKTSLGLTIGTDVQAYDADLTTWAGIAPGTGVGTFLATPSSANLAAALTDETGSGVAVFATSPTLVTPILGVAAATSINKVAITQPATGSTLTIADGQTLTVTTGGTLGSAAYTASTAYDAAGAAASVTPTTLGLVIGTNVQAYDADLTTWAGVTPAAGVATFLATPSSANLASAVTDETGSGALVFATSPTLVTPTIGVAAATSINKVALTAPATGSTLTIADGKTLTASNTLTLTATDGSTLAIGTGGTLGTAAYTASTAYDVAGAAAAVTPTTLGLVIGTNVQAYDADLTTWAGVTPGTGVATALAVAVGSAGAPVVNGGALGTPSSGTLTNCTFPTLNQNTSGTAAGLSGTPNISVGTIEASGAASVGGSLSAWEAAIHPFQNLNASLWSNGATAGLEFNTVETSGYAPKYIISSYAAGIVFNFDGIGGFQIRTAASGTAGNAITWSYPLSITQAGAVTIPGTLSAGATSVTTLAASGNVTLNNDSAAGSLKIGGFGSLLGRDPTTGATLLSTGQHDLLLNTLTPASGTSNVTIGRSVSTVTIPGTLGVTGAITGSSTLAVTTSISVPSSTRTGITFSANQILDIAATTNNTTGYTSATILNPSLQPTNRIKTTVGADEENSPTVILVHLDVPYPKPAGATAYQAMCASSIMVDTYKATSVVAPVSVHGYESGDTVPPSWGLNIQCRVGPGRDNVSTGVTLPSDSAGIEIDMVNELVDAPESATAAGHSYSYWAQADTATARLNGTAFFASTAGSGAATRGSDGSVTGSGWRNALYADGYITTNLAYLRTSSTYANGVTVDLPTSTTGKPIIVKLNGVENFSVAGTGHATVTSAATGNMLALSSSSTTANGLYANLPTSSTGYFMVLQTNSANMLVANADGSLYLSQQTAPSATPHNALNMGNGGPAISFGTGDPTHTAAKGTIYIRTDATTTTTRMWINTNGSTTWTYFTTAA